MQPQIAKDPLFLICGSGRTLAIVPSSERVEVMRVFSAPSELFNFGEAVIRLGVDPSLGVILLPENQEALDHLKAIVPPDARLTVSTKTPDSIGAIITNHLRMEGVVHHLCLARRPAELPPNIQRLFDRLGEDGNAIIGGQSVFATSRANYRVAVGTYVKYRQLESSKSDKDATARELLAWNLVSQTYVAIENFAAMFAALKATQQTGDYASFALTYLGFGRGEGDVQGASVKQMMDSILGKRFERTTLIETLMIPVNPEMIRKSGLADCGVDPALLVLAGRRTYRTLLSEFRIIASALIAGRNEVDGAPIVTPGLRAYGAFRHGSALGIPGHSPVPTVLGVAPGRFKSELEFLEYYGKQQSMGEILYLGDKRGADGRRIVERVSPPVDSRDVKPFVRMLYRANKWTRELANYGVSLYGSRNGQYPYLLNSIEVLGPDGRTRLQARLEDMLA